MAEHIRKVGKFQIRSDLFDGRRNLDSEESSENEIIGNRNSHVVIEDLNLQDLAAALPEPVGLGAVKKTLTFENSKNLTDSMNQKSQKPKTRGTLDESFYPADIHAAQHNLQNQNNMPITPVNRKVSQSNNLFQNLNTINRNVNSQNNNVNRNTNNIAHNVVNNPNVARQKINDILQMALLVPIFDSTESSFENFEISCNDAANILAVSDQKIFLKYIREKFVGPVSLYVKIKLNSYRSIAHMLSDIKQNFLVRTPIHVLESEIFSTSQKSDETVREFGAKLANLENAIVKRIVDKGEWPIQKKNLKIAEISSKIKKQFVDGLRRDLYIQFSLVNFNNRTLDDMIKTVAKSESRNKRNEVLDKSEKKVNFEHVNFSQTELIEAITIAVNNATRRSRSREKFEYDRYNRNYSRDRYRNRSNSRENRRDYRNDLNRRYERRNSYDKNDRYNSQRSHSRDRKNYGSRNSSFDRRRDNSGNRHRDYSHDRNRDHSNENFKNSRRNRDYSSDRDSDNGKRGNKINREEKNER